jgi:hypothetical protein
VILASTSPRLRLVAGLLARLGWVCQVEDREAIVLLELAVTSLEDSLELGLRLELVRLGNDEELGAPPLGE